MSFYDIIKREEKVYKGVKDVNYFYMPPETESNKLIVMFSGFNGQEAKGKPASYNYVKPMSLVDAHRLFILDSYDGHPCYYLGKNKLLDYEVSTISLIYSFSNNLGISPRNIITCGSSKGGTAAIYFAMKYTLGNAVVGGFQFEVGSYLKNVTFYARERVLKLITGGVKDSHEAYLNSFYYNFFKSVKYNQTKLYIHGGSGDPHYLNHVKPFLGLMDEREIPYQLDLKPYDSHTYIGEFYSEFLLNKLPEITETLLIKKIQVTTKNNQIELEVVLPESLKGKSEIEYAYYIFEKGKKFAVKKVGYSKSHTFIHKPESNIPIKIKVFIKDEYHKATKTTEYISI